MHIKQVVIRGFKTYKDQVSLAEDFHQGVNVVVGFNGSGKSNFFNAILFVISDHYGRLQAETRKSLLHEGAGPAVLTAFVELVFHNADRRMPIDKDEVRVRRTIGVKKDDYALDGKHVTKAEVFNLLESCGFTKSNPYYIVQQGKVSELTLMNDLRRLELIKEVSGASVYDERKAESEKILEEMRARRQKTDEVVGVIAQRIGSLEEEQKELVEYQSLERERRCLEFELTDRDWRTAQERIDALEVERRDAGVRLHEAQRDVVQLRTRLNDAETEVQQVTSQRLRTAVEREEAEKALVARMEELTRARLELDDEARRAKEREKLRNDANAEVQRLKEEIARVQQELEEQRPRLVAGKAERHDLLRRKQVCEAQRDQAIAKQGRRSQYTSVQQRNAALSEEISRRKQRRDRSTKMLRECEAEAKRAEGSARTAAGQLEALRGDARRFEQDLSQRIAPELGRLGERLERSAEERRLLTQNRDKLHREQQEAERQVSQYQGRIESTMPRPQRNALHEVRHWVKRQGLEGRVYGTLLENIEVPSAYQIAAESVAGAALFNLLVRDDAVAGQIVSQVRKGSLGSIVCTPLNQVQARPRQYPKIAGVKPLVDVIVCPQWVAPAVHQVFGKTVMCSTLELCDEVSRRYQLDTITLDGDKVTSRGALTGGYQDPTRFVRLTFAEKARQAQAAAEARAPQLAEVEVKVQDAARDLEALHGERRNLQDERGQRRAELTQAAEAAQEAEQKVARHEELARQHLERKDELQSQIAECNAAVEALEAEARLPTLSDLTVEEQNRLQRLTEENKELDVELEAADERCHQLQREFKGREQHVEDFLRKRLHEQESELIWDSQAEHNEHVQERSNTVARLEREHAELGAGLEASNNRLRELDAVLGQRKDEHERLQTEDQQLQSRISGCTSRLDEVVMKVNNLTRKKNEADEKLRSLTVVSTDTAKYKRLNPSQLVKELAKTNKDLAKFEHVNKKAMDQFTTFTDQLTELERKRQEIDESKQAVEGFMRQVDEQKETTLQQTLEQIDKHFGEIFKDLVGPRTWAKLRMLREDESADKEADGEGAGLAKGVRIEVSFTGQSSSFLTMAQLSGGQKTVVAIALIFAIQRLEPAPFYLFDEIDAALDTQYRTAVARLIAREAKNAQMVITTFRPEVIETADRFYRVYQKNRVSRIDCVPREEAKRVIEEQTRLEKIDG